MDSHVINQFEQSPSYDFRISAVFRECILTGNALLFRFGLDGTVIFSIRQLLEVSRNEYGLCPKGQYCGDISTLVYSLTVNAKGWRALRDLSTVLAQTGNAAEAQLYADNAAAFRKATLTAIDKSMSRETTPPFVPVALYNDELVHDPITANRIGCYWNIVIGYVIGSGIFPPGTEQEAWIPHYQEQHGGLCMGMLRAGGGYTFWTSSAG